MTRINRKNLRKIFGNDGVATRVVGVLIEEGCSTVEDIISYSKGKSVTEFSRLPNMGRKSSERLIAVIKEMEKGGE